MAMGIQDREYYRQPGAPIATTGGGLGAMRWWRVTTWLIAINAAVFVLDLMLQGAGLRYTLGFVSEPDGSVRALLVSYRRYVELTGASGGAGVNWMGPLEAIGYFSVSKAIYGLQVWRWLSFQFLHANFGHLLGNMLGLFFFGTVIEAALGRWRFLAFYLLCGIAGPVVYIFFALVGILGTEPYTPLIGASAGVFGVLIAAAQIAPRATVMLILPPIPMQLRTLAWVLLGVAAFTVFTQGPNAGGEAAHLGGAALGLLLIRKPQLLSWAQPRSRRLVGGKVPEMTYHGWR